MFANGSDRMVVRRTEERADCWQLRISPERARQPELCRSGPSDVRRTSSWKCYAQFQMPATGKRYHRSEGRLFGLR